MKDWQPPNLGGDAGVSCRQKQRRDQWRTPSTYECAHLPQKVSPDLVVHIGVHDVESMLLEEGVEAVGGVFGVHVAVGLLEQEPRGSDDVGIVVDDEDGRG
jgi:hypothetical protein